jgi:hypothetical protein
MAKSRSENAERPIDITQSNQYKEIISTEKRLQHEVDALKNVPYDVTHSLLIYRILKSKNWKVN